jgi:hypothetical protein
MAYNLYKTAKAGKFVRADRKCRSRWNPKPAAGGRRAWAPWHRWLEGVPVTFTVLTVVAVLIGG